MILRSLYQSVNLTDSVEDETFDGENIFEVLQPGSALKSCLLFPLAFAPFCIENKFSGNRRRPWSVAKKIRKGRRRPGRVVEEEEDEDGGEQGQAKSDAKSPPEVEESYFKKENFAAPPF